MTPACVAQLCVRSFSGVFASLAGRDSTSSSSDNPFTFLASSLVLIDFQCTLLFWSSTYSFRLPGRRLVGRGQVLHMRGLPTHSRDSNSHTVWTIPPSQILQWQYEVRERRWINGRRGAGVGKATVGNAAQSTSGSTQGIWTKANNQEQLLTKPVRDRLENDKTDICLYASAVSRLATIAEKLGRA